MDAADTATFGLTRGEARELINALSEYRTEVSGRDETQALHIREFLQREFEFEERHFGEDDTWGGAVVDIFDDDIFNDDGENEIQLSQGEAAEIVPALAELEADSSSEAETIAGLQDQFKETFDLDANSAT